MLNDAELSRLCSQLALTSEAMGHALSPAAAAMMADDLSIYPLQALERALKRVRAQHTGKLGTKVVLDQLEALAGRLAPSEAWALALKSNDEGETIVWTDEICQALEQSMPLLRAGDKVGARMAFIAAYERITITAREQRQLPTVQVTFGTNRELRQLALTTAIERNQISAPMGLVRRQSIRWTRRSTCALRSQALHPSHWRCLLPRSRWTALVWPGRQTTAIRCSSEVLTAVSWTCPRCLGKRLCLIRKCWRCRPR